MHRTAAAECDQREVPRIIPTVHGHQLQGIHHVGIGQADHAQGRCFY